MKRTDDSKEFSFHLSVSDIAHLTNDVHRVMTLPKPTITWSIGKWKCAAYCSNFGLKIIAFGSTPKKAYLAWKTCAQIEQERDLNRYIEGFFRVAKAPPSRIETLKNRCKFRLKKIKHSIYCWTHP